MLKNMSFFLTEVSIFIFLIWGISRWEHSPLTCTSKFLFQKSKTSFNLSCSWLYQPPPWMIGRFCKIQSQMLWKWKWSRSVVSDSLRPHGLYVAHQAPPSMGFSRQEYWSGLPFPSPGDLPDPGIEPRYPALRADALTSEPPGKHPLCDA